MRDPKTNDLIRIVELELERARELNDPRAIAQAEAFLDDLLQATDD